MWKEFNLWLSNMNVLIGKIIVGISAIIACIACILSDDLLKDDEDEEA